MSAIAGIVRFDGADADVRALGPMLAAIAFRGSDGSAVHAEGPAAFAHAAHRTTPESLTEHQPLSDETGRLTLVLDGWLSNWEELRADLLAAGARLRDRSDAELVLHAFRNWGEDCLDRLDGDFAFALWDRAERRLFCARDRGGVRPFVWHWDGRRFAFASGPAALLALDGVPRIPNEGLIAEFLATRWHTIDETFWQGIRSLPFAHSLTVDESGPRLARYWSPDLARAIRYRRPDDYAEHYRELLFDEVRRHSRSHAPVACEVSGGLDSSAIFAVADALEREGRLPAPGTDGYTLAYDDGSPADELAFARAVGTHLGREIREIAPWSAPLGWHRDYARRHAVFPPYPHGTNGRGILEAARAAGSRVLLTGIGGDEWLGGSRAYYAETLAALDLRAFLACARADAGVFGWRSVAGLALRHGLLPLLPAALRDTARPLRGDTPEHRLRGAHLTPRMAHLLAAQAEKRYHPDFAAASRVGQRAQLISFHHPLGRMVREMQAWFAADAGIEQRAPLHARRMVEFSFATPERWRLAGGLDKLTHRAALTGLLPESVRLRRSKATFMRAFDPYTSPLERFCAAAGGDATPLDWVTPEGLAEQIRKARDQRTGGWAARAAWGFFGCRAAISDDKDVNSQTDYCEW